MLRTFLGGSLLALLAGGGLLYVANEQASATPQHINSPAVAAAVPTTVAQAIVAQAKVVPLDHVALQFTGVGTVAEVLVAEGEHVQRGQPLARLDTAALSLSVAQAAASLAQAQAAYQRLEEGATPADLAIAQAALTRAQAQYSQTAGAVTSADIAAATSARNQAQAALTLLEGGPKAPAVAAARANVDQATAIAAQQVAALQATRDSASKAKTDAESALAQAAMTLQRAQADYSVAYWKYQGVVRNGSVPGSVNGQPEPSVTDYGNLEQQEAFKQAEIALHAAELGVTQAQVAADQAGKAEVSAIQQGEQQLAAAQAAAQTAQANLDALLAGADAAQLAAARAQVAQATAALQKLQGQQRAGSLEAAAADVTNADAQIDRLKLPPRITDLASAQAQVQQAEVSLRIAQLALRNATLVAPITGEVAQLNIEAGEVPLSGQPAVVLADLSAWRIETEDLTELNIVPIHTGDIITATFDGVPGLELPGRVSRIKAIGQNRQGDITYTVVIIPAALDTRLRWNMTATVTIARR